MLASWIVLEIVWDQLIKRWRLNGNHLAGNQNFLPLQQSSSYNVILMPRQWSPSRTKTIGCKTKKQTKNPPVMFNVALPSSCVVLTQQIFRTTQAAVLFIVCLVELSVKQAGINETGPHEFFSDTCKSCTWHFKQALYVESLIQCLTTITLI